MQELYVQCTLNLQDTPYEGGLFKVDIQLDAQYPFAPPKMKFITRVWHPNVSSQSGAICLGMQTEQRHAWMLTAEQLLAAPLGLGAGAVLGLWVGGCCL